ncbi:hypothetical protein [Streptomyces cucumeris]|uniref:hypothetical protein n=1 Tax=Streptomyces cucumeris TaxID=2962890 RepID=UPI003D735592
MNESLPHGSPEARSGLDGGIAAENFAEAVEADLLELRRLIEATVTKYRHWMAQDSLITAVGSDREDIEYAARHLVAEAAESIDVLATDAEFTGAVRATCGALGSRRRDVRLRLLSSDAMLSGGLIHSAVLERPNTELRVAGVPTLQMLIVDNRAAMVTTPATGHQTSLVRATSLIEALGKLFDGLWDRAVNVKNRIDLDELNQARAPSEVLERLRAGVTDEVAARELAISVRTYRRYIAEIMKVLGANSRFQVGVRAAELGLLRESPGVPLAWPPDHGNEPRPRGGSR